MVFCTQKLLQNVCGVSRSLFWGGGVAQREEAILLHKWNSIGEPFETTHYDDDYDDDDLAYAPGRSLWCC